MEILVEVVRAAVGRADARPLWHRVEAVAGSTGIATHSVHLVLGEAATAIGPVEYRLVSKRLRPVGSGRHAHGARDPRHWAYWRREALAYTDGPGGTGVVKPDLFGIVEGPGEEAVLYLAHLPPGTVDDATAARHLGRWQGEYLRQGVPDRPWLAGHQLAQRVEATDTAGGLDWSAPALPPALRERLAASWADRHRHLAALDAVPRTLCHGDFHAENLFRGDADRTVAIDWGGLGVGPAGADLAHLALSGPDADGLLDAYLAGLAEAGWTGDPAPVRLGYAVTLGLTAVSRVHWLRTRDPDAPIADLVERVFTAFSPPP